VQLSAARQQTQRARLVAVPCDRSGTEVRRSARSHRLRRIDLAQLDQTEYIQRARLDKLAVKQRQLHRHEQQRAAWAELHATDMVRAWPAGWPPKA
jgi:hypothetical protein